MKIKSYISLGLLFFGGVLTIGIYYWFIHTTYFEAFLGWVEGYKVFYFFVLVSIKIFGIVWPPLPGGVFTIGSIPVIGWFFAWLADFIGTIFGAFIAYHLGAKYGYKILNKLFDKEIVEKVKAQKIKEGKEFEAILVFRVMASLLLNEAISYGSGVLGVNRRSFLLATVISLIIQLPAFYLVNNVLENHNRFLSITILGIALVVLYRLKGRYFE